MKRPTAFILPILFVLSIMAHAGDAAEVKGSSQATPGRIAGSYVIAKNYRLTKSVHGVDGVLQLLQDSRLPKDAYNKLFGTAFSEMHMIDEKLLPLFKDNPPLGTVLRVLAQDKKFFWIKESHSYDLVPVAWLEEVMLTGSGRPSYLFTQDLSVGMGSYAGPLTCFYEIIDGKLKPIEYFDQGEGKRKQITVMRSLKTNWKLVKSKDGGSKDILHVACRPNAENDSNDETEFVIYYDRFHFDGKQWVKLQRIEKGYWEIDAEEFPPLSKFP